MTTVLPRVEPEVTSGPQTRILINNEWVNSLSVNTFPIFNPVFNPATGAQVAEADAAGSM